MEQLTKGIKGLDGQTLGIAEVAFAEPFVGETIHESMDANWFERWRDPCELTVEDAKLQMRS